MTRKKKSRKLGSTPAMASKKDKKNLVTPDKKPKKHTGKVAGNRQKEAQAAKKTVPAQQPAKDPRIGSKKPIPLDNTASQSRQVKQPSTSKKPQDAPLAAIRVLSDQSHLFAELEAIENDAKLQEILAKQEDDVNLTEAEVDYFNEKMDRHQELTELLDLDDDEPTAPKTHRELDDDALWDRLDNNNLADFE